MAPVAVPKKPGVAGIVMGIVIAVVGLIAGAVVMTFGALGGVVSGAIDVSNAPDFAADASDYYVDATAGTTMAFWFPSGANGRCAVFDPNGNEVTPVQPNYTSNSGDLQVVLTFDATVDGSYDVACLTSGDAFNYRVAPSLLTSGVKTSLIVGGAIMGVMLIIGIALLIVSIVRRANWTKNHGSAMQPMMYPPQDPPQQAPYPQQYPPQQAPYPQQYPPQQAPYPPQQAPYPPQ